MAFKVIDVEHWNRKIHFDYYQNMDFPHYALTANVDITEFYKYVKEKQKPFSTSFLFAIAKAVNQVPALRLRIRENCVIEHNETSPSITYMANDGVCAFMTAKYIDNFARFVENTIAQVEIAKQTVRFSDDEGDELFYTNSIPWVSFTSFKQPEHFHPVDSIPRITWGKYFTQGDKLLIPVAIEVHHGLVDGQDIGDFYQSLQEILSLPDLLTLYEPDEEELKTRAYNSRILRSNLNQKYRAEYPYKL